MTEPNYKKSILQANGHRKPRYIEQEVDGFTYKAIMVANKIYIPKKQVSNRLNNSHNYAIIRLILD